MISIKNIILDVLFPLVCVGCFKDIKEENHLCDDCKKSIIINTAFLCPTCGARLADNKLSCNHSSKNYRYILGAAASYNDPVINNLIHYFKYENLSKLAFLFSEILIEFIKKSKFDVYGFCVIPIPLHASRERQRGYNQSKLIAEILSDKLRIEFIDGLKRIKKTKPQAQAKKSEYRKENIKDCFEVVNAAKITGKNILLIDDVFTSGSTMTEAVNLLKSSGAKKVVGLVIAKA